MLWKPATGALLFAVSMAVGAQSTGISKTEITVGTIQDLSGPIAAYGKQSRNGLQMRADEINELGGVNGRKIKLVTEDHGYDPRRALLAAQKLTISQRRNLDRALSFQTVVTARAKSGLNPGVDSSLANAEVSNARIALTNAIEFQQEQANQLAQLMQVPAPDSNNYPLDSVFVSKIPNALSTPPAQSIDNHPLLKFFKERINVSDEQAKYLKTFNYPTFSLFGVFQDRGSGFGSTYGANPNAYTSDYLKGVSFGAANYVVGVGVTWNLTTPIRIHQQVAAQKWTSEGLKEEYGLVNQQLKAQLVLSETRIKNSLDNYREAPVQVKAASDAYLQKATLYKNGLATIVDVTTASFILNQAETQRDIAFNNVWQALLFKAASSGDFALFFNEF